MIECLKQVVGSHLLESVAALLRANLGENVIITIAVSENDEDHRKALQRDLRDRFDLDVYDPREYILVPAPKAGPAGPDGDPGRPTADDSVVLPVSDYASDRFEAGAVLSELRPHSDLGDIIDRAADRGYSVNLSLYPRDHKNEDDDPNRV